MTTIAWDGKTLAADSMGDQNCLRMKAVKVHRGVLADGKAFIFGGAGRTSDCIQLYEWIKTLDSKTLTRELYPHQSDANDPTCLLAVKRDGVFRKTGPLLVPVYEDFYAVGSGRDFAISAMHFGKTAAEAVKHAIQFDLYSGGAVRTMTLEKL